MRTKGEVGISPYMMAEKRGKNDIVLCLLSCYQAQVRKRHMLRQMGDAVADVSHPYLTKEVIKHKRALQFYAS